MAMATKAIYTSTSGTSHRACTAKSPSMRAPSMLKELLSASGVLRLASFSRSTTKSSSSSCSSRGTLPGSSGTMNCRYSGTRLASFTSRYHTGVMNRASSITTMRRYRR